MLELRGPVVAALEVTQHGYPGQAYFRSENRADLSAAQWSQIIEKLDPFVSEFRVSGGEPLSRPDVFDILDSLEQAKRPYHIFTSGVWSDRPAVLIGLKKLAYVQSVLIYLHGADAPTHAAVAEERNFDEALKSIELTAASGLEVSTSTVITRQNASQLEAIVELASRKGARHSVFNRYVGPAAPQFEADAPTLQTAIAQLEELRQLGYNVALGSCVPACFFKDFSQGCSAAITYCAIDPWGQMRPCDHSPTTIGSLLERGVTELWRSSKMRAWRNRIPNGCKKCSKITFCPAGCRSAAEQLNLETDPLIGEPIPVEEPALMEVTLEEDLCPVPKYAIREEDFGWSLIRQTHVIPVTRKAGKVLHAFDGKTTLGQIEKQHGAAALSFVYSLYERNFVDFRPAEMAEV